MNYLKMLLPIFLSQCLFVLFPLKIQMVNFLSDSCRSFSWDTFSLLGHSREILQKCEILVLRKSTHKNATWPVYGW